MRVNSEGRLAASLPGEWISFGPAIDATSIATRRSVDFVEGIAVAAAGCKGGNAVPALFLDGSHGLSSRGNEQLLVAAAFAAANCTIGAWTLGREDFRTSRVFLDFSLPSVNRRATSAAKTIVFVETRGEFCSFTFFEILELLFEIATHIQTIQYSAIDENKEI